ncbi:MAG: T9SS type A sorting domain-containing protein [Flavobacteriales bacterium]|nr:T9SS type A sorting domain-containing protein [Flavobacteriales bacterium]MCB9449303.1 T9SS type A sorting domain-containing protein [Flavobacteriales bacterium]
MTEHPELAQMQEQLEAFTADWVKAHPPSSKRSNGTPLYIIPVVIHIIHNYGTENFPDAQVYDAIRIINEDFQKRNYDTTSVSPSFKNLIADVQVAFRLAQIDPNGNCTNGITRTASVITYNADNDVAIKSLVVWNTSMYLNVWVVNNIPGAGGYAYYPGTTQPSREGIVIRNTQFGSILTSLSGNLSARSLTHEVGHYFNLRHTWGDSNTPGEAGNCNTDDLVDDTPNTMGANLTCDLNEVTCGSLDNVNNYMDYSGCGRMYTEGQKTRMDAALNSTVGSRSNLWSNTNLIATGTNDGYVGSVCAPIADFRPTVRFLCAGDSISFSHTSWNATADSITTEWTFQGGTPGSSQLENPFVLYNTPGVYDVKVKVSTSGGADSILSTGIVHVMEDTAQMKAPAAQDFQSISFPDANWFNLSESVSANEWTLTTAASVSGDKSIRIDNYNKGSEAEESSFVTPTFDISGLTLPNLTFQLAYAQRTSSDGDKLQVYASTDCGKTWKLRYTKSGSLLNTASGVKASSFVPNASEWREETISLNYAVGASSIRFKFAFTSNLGNNIYIDDINVDGVNGINDAFERSLGLQLYPNPTGDASYLSFKLEGNREVEIWTTDLTGKRVALNMPSTNMASGIHGMWLANEGTGGVYLIHVRVDHRVVVRKWMKIY